MHSSRAVKLSVAAYLITLSAIVALVLQVRHTTLRDMDTPEARAQWQAWREAEPNQANDGPVRRRPPESVEPPELLLMRDHFAVVMSAAVLFGSLLFAAILMAVRGVLAPGSEHGSTPDKPAR
jgi:hypothetical protein